MATEIVMPKLGMAMENGTVVAWLKQVGEPVEKGEVVVQVQSEKIEYDVESPAAGVLIDIVVPEGGIVPYGTVIGYIGEAGEIPPSKRPEPAAPSEHVARETAETGHVKITPVARRMAKAAGLDIRQLVGSGPEGRITKEDVEKAIAARDFGEHRAQSEPAAARLEVSEPTPKPVSAMRRIIASRMTQSLQQSAQVTMTMKADVTEVLALQQQYGSYLSERYDIKITLTDFVARAVVLALLEHPDVNSTWADETIFVHKEVNLGIAVALDTGLIVPVIHGANRMSFLELAKAVKAVSERAKTAKLIGDEAQGSTFTITNLGPYGVEFFTPILNPPETGILGVGMVQDRPVYIGETVQRRSMLPLSLTFDHRVIDGAPAAKFLATVKAYLEKPIAMLF